MAAKIKRETDILCPTSRKSKDKGYKEMITL